MYGDNPGAWIDEMREQEKVETGKEVKRILNEFGRTGNLARACGDLCKLIEEG
jgi:hypothetical protein